MVTKYLPTDLGVSSDASVRKSANARNKSRSDVKSMVGVVANSNAAGNREPFVIGPDGTALTIADLPPASTKRWVIRRKAEVVAAVRGGLLSLESACERYSLTAEEYASWERAIDRYGMQGLRATRVQQYR